MTMRGRDITDKLCLRNCKQNTQAIKEPPRQRLMAWRHLDRPSQYFETNCRRSDSIHSFIHFICVSFQHNGSKKNNSILPEFMHNTFTGNSHCVFALDNDLTSDYYYYYYYHY
jgi:hypothetical protein